MSVGLSMCSPPRAEVGRADSGWWLLRRARLLESGRHEPDSAVR